MLSESLNIEYDAVLHIPLLRLMTAALQAGQMPIWTGVGRRVLEHAWKLHCRLGVELFGALAEVGWRGWNMVGTPLLLRRTLEGLEHEPALMLRLLTQLQEAKKLGEVDHVWKQLVGKWVEGELANWTQTEEKVRT
jgi:U3 small nucleolar RNA-associated protein 20